VNEPQIPTNVSELSPEQLHGLVHAATAQALADQLALISQTNKEAAELLRDIQQRGLPVRGGITMGVFFGLLLWTVFPAILLLAQVLLGGLAAIAS